jgi:hypothetical protein
VCSIVILLCLKRCVLLVRFRLHGRDREVEQIRTFVARAPTTTVQSDTRWRQQHDALQFHKTASHQHVCCVFGIGGGGVFCYSVTHG